MAHRQGSLSANELAAQSLAPKQWPKAPRQLSAKEAENWDQIVRSLPENWFKKADYPLLVAYCQQITLSNRLAQQVNACPESKPLPQPLVEKMSEANSILGQLATKLRLTVRSRTTGRKTLSAIRKTPDTPEKPWETYGPLRANPRNGSAGKPWERN